MTYKLYSCYSCITCSYGLLEILYFPGFLDSLAILANDVIFLLEKLSIG